MYYEGDQENRPTKQDFDDFDINADGVVTFEELMETFDEEMQAIFVSTGNNVQ